MKKLAPFAVPLLLLLAACQADSSATEETASAKKEQAPAVALCEFTSTDSASAMAWLPGKWELRGIQTNYMGAREDEFLTGEQVGDAKTLQFYQNGEYEELVNGRLQGERKAFQVIGQSLTPVGYQFWFCGENTLVISNVAADGATEVFVKAK
ncbi:hypothetical protein [Rufibacter psychrotolerans]|uniref:hypothetical protein n=1 Tax=Rufibacter psychrotolerans TaxID=2812556 RepID=UPI00196719D1|nr:hypothetical protein [Rufibacter sp. SYSU D00308]